MSSSVVSQLRDLAAKLERNDAGAVQDACQTIQQVGREMWSQRKLPQPCMDLAKLMDGSATQQKITIKVAQPNPISAYVAFISREGKLEAVAKQRGAEAKKSAREECHFQIADFLGAGDVTAPCIGEEINLWLKCKEVMGPDSSGKRETDADNGSAWSLLAEKMAEAFTAQQGTCPPTIWVTVEKCVPVGGAAGGIGSRIANKFGCCDIDQCYAAIPAGQAAGAKAHHHDDPPSDADFLDVIHHLRVASVHRLCILQSVVQQRDGSAPNLMIRELAQSGKDRYELAAIDPTTCLGTVSGDQLKWTTADDDTSPLAYWYPYVLGLPQTSQVFDADVRKGLLSLEPSDLEACIMSQAGAPGAGFSSSEADAKAAAARLKQLQTLVQNEPELSVRECCFRIVPSWKRDFQAAGEAGCLGPMPEIEKSWATYAGGY